MSNLRLELLEDLSRRRWTAGLLAFMCARGGGVRFVELLNGLGISRESLARTLETALSDGWLARNPGYGHPLRPEYALTPAGQAAAPVCARLEAARFAIELPAAALCRWSLPVLYLAGRGERRFAGLAGALPRSNPRALSHSLKSLVDQNLMTRRIIDSYPPAPDYGLSPRGARLAEALDA